MGDKVSNNNLNTISTVQVARHDQATQNNKKLKADYGPTIDSFDRLGPLMRELGVTSPDDARYKFLLLEFGNPDPVIRTRGLVASKNWIS